MSEFLGDKEEALKRIIQRLHQGEPVESVKKDFHKLIRNVSPEEIASMEQALMDEGLPASEIQNLCEVHVEVFESSLKRSGSGGKLPGHPVHTYKLENRELKMKLRRGRNLSKRAEKNRGGREAFGSYLEEIKEFLRHYERKENQLFPRLETTGFTGPSKVMWGKHDEIRGALKELLSRCSDSADSGEGLSGLFKVLKGKMEKMVFMEERILFPTALKKLEDRQWALIRKEEPEIGYVWIEPGNVWDSGIILSKSMTGSFENLQTSPPSVGEIPLDVGALLPKQINLLLKALPVDVTYVDENDKVLYYTGSEHRVFPRSASIIGRDVQNCHPPDSVEVVERILKAFKEKSRDEAEFWLEMGGRFIHIRYFPLFDSEGVYWGVIEVSQDVTDIRALSGQRRLLDW